jgi:biopolymer transport protein ExbD
MKNITVLIPLSAFLLLLTTGCAPQSNIHTQEAAAFCEIYNPQNWKDFPENASLEEFNDELAKRISAIVVTEEFRKIFKLFNDERHPNFYHSVKQQISELVGQEWDCLYFRNFYIKPRKEIQISIDGISEVAPLEKGKEVVVSIDSDGKLYVDSNPLVNSNANTLVKAIQITATTDKPKIVVRVDSGAPHQAFITVIDAANQLGINKLSIETN